MDSFTDKIAVITGAGDGMGRALARQLSAQGAHLALCDIFEETLAETERLCRIDATDGLRITTHICDVGVEANLITFRDEVLEQHATTHINLLFNNAGIGGGGSMVDGERSQWDRTFDVCWGGVYWGTRAFMDALVASEEAVIVNTSSVNGFWASIGPDRPHTAYCAAKFAVKGFTEALTIDLLAHAPHVRAAVVMPGHIGTGIAGNSALAHGADMVPEIAEASAGFRNSAPTTADEAADIILDGVRTQRWRILVGEDAHILDMNVRETPEDAYEPDFVERLGGALQALLP